MRERRPAQGAALTDRRVHRTAPADQGITAEQARRELERRQLPKEQRGKGRARAHEDGTFYLSGEELVAIAEGWA